MGWWVANHRYLNEKLTLWGVVFRWIGLRRHNIYWDDQGGCWFPELLTLWGLSDNTLPAQAVRAVPHEPSTDSEEPIRESATSP